MSLKCACGNETYETDGICVICKTFSGQAEESVIPAKAGNQKSTGFRVSKRVFAESRSDKCGMTKKQQNGGVKMAAKTSIKKCEHCGSEYKPTSNAQKYCTDCGKKVNLEKAKNKKRSKKPKVKIKEKSTPVIARSGETKQSLDIYKIVSQIIAKRDALKFEIVKLDGALITLHELTGIPVPMPEFLRTE